MSRNASRVADFPEVGFGELAIGVPQARLNEALAADAFACSVSAVWR
jgi:hypothetical protein